MARFSRTKNLHFIILNPKKIVKVLHRKTKHWHEEKKSYADTLFFFAPIYF